MATVNFPSVNTNTVFAFGMNKYCEESDIQDYGLSEDMLGQYDDEQTQMDFENEVDLCKEMLESKDWFEPIYGRMDGEIMHKYKDVEYCGVQFTIHICALVHSGYYEGACFDFVGYVEFGGGYEYELTGSDNFGEENVIDDDLLDNPGLSKIHAKNIEKRVYKEFNPLVAEVVEAFTAASETKMNVLARLDNGSALYSRSDF